MRKRWPRVIGAIAVLSLLAALFVVGCKKLNARHACGSRAGKLSKHCAKSRRAVRKPSSTQWYPVTSQAAEPGKPLTANH
jgi:hypothetical protein